MIIIIFIIINHLTRLNFEWMWFLLINISQCFLLVADVIIVTTSQLFQFLQKMTSLASQIDRSNVFQY